MDRTIPWSHFSNVNTTWRLSDLSQSDKDTEQIFAVYLFQTKFTSTFFFYRNQQSHHWNNFTSDMNNSSFRNAAISERYGDIRTRDGYLDLDDEVDYKYYFKYFWYFDDINLPSYKTIK